MIKTSVLSLMFVAVAVKSQCPEGWIEIDGAPACYKMDWTRVTWPEARDVCASWGEDSKLAMLETDGELDAIHEWLRTVHNNNKAVWTGYLRDPLECGWRYYMDISDVVGSWIWDIDQPQNNGEIYAASASHRQTSPGLHDYSGVAKFHTMCQSARNADGSCPAGFEEIENAGGCFLWEPYPVRTWLESRDLCHALGDKVKLPLPETHKQLAALMNFTSAFADARAIEMNNEAISEQNVFWTGYKNDPEECGWRYYMDMPAAVDSFNWDVDQPQNGTEIYAASTSDRQTSTGMHDFGIQGRWATMCQVPKIGDMTWW